MRIIGFISEEKYNLLISCFKCGVPKKIICRLTRLSYRRVCNEWERWRLCNKISGMEPPQRKPRWNEVHLSNSSKVFGY